MRFSILFSLLLASSGVAAQTLESSVGNLSSALETVNSSDISCSPETDQWIKKNIRNEHLVGPNQRGSLEFLMETFKCRLQSWDKYKPFYDQLFSKEEIKKAYPDALPQEQTKNGLFMLIRAPGQKITDGTPLEHLKGKTVGEVFGYPGDRRDFSSTPAMASRQLWIVSPTYFTQQTHDRYNDAYHEFGHLVHLSLMKESEYNEIEALYKDAKSKNNFMDDYAAQSSAEYFAQGLEAYLSETKNKLINWKYHVHTRASLQKADPKLFDFVKRIVESSGPGCI